MDELSLLALCKVPISQTKRNYPSSYEPDTDKYYEEEERRKDQTRIRQMVELVGVKVYRDVL